MPRGVPGRRPCWPARSPDPLRHLLSRYAVADIAHRVVGPAHADRTEADHEARVGAVRGGRPPALFPQE